jgi:hypothetical protein
MTTGLDMWTICANSAAVGGLWRVWYEEPFISNDRGRRISEISLRLDFEY